MSELPWDEIVTALAAVVGYFAGKWRGKSRATAEQIFQWVQLAFYASRDFAPDSWNVDQVERMTLALADTAGFKLSPRERNLARAELARLVGRAKQQPDDAWTPFPPARKDPSDG